MQESSQNQFGKELTVTRITKIKQQKGGGGVSMTLFQSGYLFFFFKNVNGELFCFW